MCDDVPVASEIVVPSGTVTFLFTDLVGSTGMFHTTSDVALAYLGHLRGDDAYSPAPVTPSVYAWTQLAACELVRARHDPDLARRRLARIAAHTCDGRVPLQEASLLTLQLAPDLRHQQIHLWQ